MTHASDLLHIARKAYPSRAPAIAAGLEAFLVGRIPRKRFARASSAVDGLIA